MRLPVYHGPAALLPLALPRSVAAVVTVHDVVHRRYPETFDWVHLEHLLLSVGYSLKRADAIIADSAATASDLVTFYGVPRSKIRVIYLGLNDCFRPVPVDEARAAVRRMFSLSRPYILYVGGFGKRKNVETLLLAFRELRQTAAVDLDLVLTGGGDDETRARARALGLGDVTRFLGYVREEDFSPLYSAATAFAYPSLYEGFGYPVLEAMTCGAPVVCSRASSLPEVAGSAAILVDPLDVAGWTRALRRVAEDPEQAAAMRAAGFAQASRFSLDDEARATHDVYLRAAEEQRRQRERCPA